MTRFGKLADRIAARKEPAVEEELTLDAVRGEAKKDAAPMGALARIKARQAAKLQEATHVPTQPEAQPQEPVQHSTEQPTATPEPSTPAPTVETKAPAQGDGASKKLSLRERLAAKKSPVGVEQQPTVSAEARPEVQAEESTRPEAVEAPVEQPKQAAPEAPATPQASSPERKLSLREKIALRKAAEHNTPAPSAEPSAALNASLQKAMAPCETTQALQRSFDKSQSSLADRLRAKKEQKALAEAGEATTPKVVVSNVDDSAGRAETHDVHALPANRQAVKLNDRQQEAVDKAVAGESFCMIGAAGTGKTTSVRQLAKELLNSGALNDVDYKRQGGEGRNDRVHAPSIAFVAFTRRAANNLRDSIMADPDLAEFEYCCQTIHNLLEFYPEQYEYEDDDGNYRESMRFVPAKGSWDKLDITHLVIEEGSMVGLDLADMLMQALREGVQIIYIGDINQLPPVFGASILSYALVKLPIVELTEVYRQALDSGIIRNAHKILGGKQLEYCEDFTAYEEYSKGRGLGIMKVGTDLPDGGKPIQAGPAKLAAMYSALFKGLYQKGDYDPEQDIVLSPFNKHELGTVALNQHIAQFLGDKREAVVHEILSGFEKWYLAEGDRVMVDKQDGTIVRIANNMTYMGTAPQPAGTDLSRFGVRKFGQGAVADMDELDYSNFNVEAALDEDAKERKRAASHIVTVRLDTGGEVVLASAGDFSPQRFSLGYCLTVHKAQGCEWRTVYFVLHKSHHVAATRELFYTGVTRAREKCVLLAKDFTLQQAIKAQRIKGNSTHEKIEYFNSGALADVELVCVDKGAA